MQAILARRRANGGDYWASSDGRVYIGSPFSTVQCVSILSDLGMDAGDPVIVRASSFILDCWREDGRFRLSPAGTTYPCHTAAAAKALCRAGHAADKRLQQTFRYLLDNMHTDGGWRCKKFMFGRGPETECSNPGPTLDALDALRSAGLSDADRRLDGAVDFLLAHWVTRAPLGPCHFGIGTLFMKVEYPLLRYNILNYVYVLSFYSRARKDRRFLEALHVLGSKLVDGQVVVENPHKDLSGLDFCKKGAPSQAATRQYREILRNLQL